MGQTAGHGGSHIAVGNELYTAAAGSQFVNNPFMTVSVEDDHIDIAELFAGGFGVSRHIFRYRGFNVDEAFARRAAADLFHIHIRRFQQIAAFRRGEYRDGAGSVFRAEIGTFQRIHGNIHRGIFFGAATHFFTNIEHGSFIHFPFADNHGTADGNRIKGHAHTAYGGAVGVVLSSFTDPAAAA